MARIDDEHGRPLGGLEYPQTRLGGAMRTESGCPPRRTRLAPKFGPEETVPGLTCGYGTFPCPGKNAEEGQPPRQSICHNPVETPDERHHCETCGGDYCAAHAEPAAHDCEDISLAA